MHTVYTYNYVPVCVHPFLMTKYFIFTFKFIACTSFIAKIFCMNTLYTYCVYLLLQEFWQCVVLTVSLSINAVLGRPEGAPEAACADFVPQHGGASSSSPFPYTVNISNIGDYYIPGTTYTSEHTLRYCNMLLALLCTSLNFIKIHFIY